MSKPLIYGAEGQNRTVDTSLFRAVLCQLSYLGTLCDVNDLRINLEEDLLLTKSQTGHYRRPADSHPRRIRLTDLFPYWVAILPIWVMEFHIFYREASGIGSFK